MYHCACCVLSTVIKLCQADCFRSFQFQYILNCQFSVKKNFFFQVLHQGHAVAVARNSPTGSTATPTRAATTKTVFTTAAAIATTSTLTGTSTSNIPLPMFRPPTPTANLGACLVVAV